MKQVLILAALLLAACIGRPSTDRPRDHPPTITPRPTLAPVQAVGRVSAPAWLDQAAIGAAVLAFVGACGLVMFLYASSASSVIERRAERRQKK